MKWNIQNNRDFNLNTKLGTYKHRERPRIGAYMNNVSTFRMTLLISLLISIGMSYIILGISAQNTTITDIEMGNRYYDAGNYEKAYEYYSKSILKNPTTEAYIKQGLSLLELNEYDAALFVLDFALAYDPDFQEAIYQKDIVVGSFDVYRESSNELDGVPLNINNSDIHTFKAIAISALNEDLEALKEANKAIDLNPNDTIAYKIKGESLRNLNSHIEAIESFDKALQIDPEYTEAMNQKSLILIFDVNRPSEALLTINKAISNDNNNPTLYNTKGLALLNTDRYYEALESFNKAIELDPRYYEAYANKGLVLEKMGRFDDAVSMYDKALEIDPSSEFVRDWKNDASLYQDIT